ncbi:tripartite motif-containing protein 16-like [Pagrus major]|uniref:tripartite motif-containing protein 16-like n=1 Tax=Pagrus major TaxID=143350 RepID=UPI003CC876CC
MSNKIQKDPQVILCDLCTEEDRKPALKTCMKCEISMCVQHLQAHLTTPVFLKTHPLTEPMDLCGNTKCPQHGKLLEYYCLDDMTCVCVSCAIEDQHRLHNMKTFSTAHTELMEKLNTKQQALLVKTKEKNVSLEKWEKSEREKLGHSSVRLIEAVKNLRDIALTSVQSSIFARMVSIKTSKTSMQAAQNEKDTFRFLQMYSQVHQDVEKAKAVDLRKGLEPGSDRDKLVQEIREKGEKMMEQAGHFWGSLLTLVDPENHQKLVATSPDLIFDPQTLDTSISMSDDNRKVFYHSWLGKSFPHMFYIRSPDPSQSVPQFRKWMISLSNDCDWTIGLRDERYVKGFKEGDVYGLCCKGNQLSSLTTAYPEFAVGPLVFCRGQMAHQRGLEKRRSVRSQVINHPSENVARPQKVEIVWVVSDSLSFYSVTGQHQRRKIVTIKISSNTWNLIPFVCLEEEGTEKSPYNSGAVGFRGLASVQQQSQNQWKCTCGKVHFESSHAYSHGGCSYPQSSRATCSCGKVIGALHITKVLCELL